MNNGISGYKAGHVNPYRQLERPDASPAAPRDTRTSAIERSRDRIELASDLSDAESQMIDRQFPASETMKHRLYGPGSENTAADPTTRGRRLDLRG